MSFNKIIYLLAMSVVCLMPLDMKATHIIGGDITYRHITGDRYEITLSLRRDCNLGEAFFDNQASIGIYSSSTNYLIQEIRIPFLSTDTIGSTMMTDCGFEGTAVCVQSTVYKDTISLPFRDGGYILAYQRCCRNGSLTNIEKPLETGTTEWVELTEEALRQHNSAPRFKEWPDIYHCVNESLIFDHSAIDPDGDSLVYKLSTPYDGATIFFPMPQPPYLPPYSQVFWKSPFDVNNMMGGEPLTIDPHTGILTAKPNIVGQFLVGVSVEEYRDGQLISVVRRDFQYNVFACLEPIKADFEISTNTCDSLIIKTANLSENSTEYLWNFNYPNTDSKYISSEEIPEFRYEEAGIYTIQLISKSTTRACDDIVYKTIEVSGGSYHPDISLVSSELEICEGSQVPILEYYNPDLTYTWSSIEGIDFTDPTNPIFLGLESQTYSVTVSDSNLCENSAEVNFIVHSEPPPLVVSGDRDLCGSTGQFMVDGEALGFEWSEDFDFENIISTDSTLDFDFIDLDSMTYYVKVYTEFCGEKISEVSVFNRDFNLEYDSLVALCGIETVDIIFSSSNENMSWSFDVSDSHVIGIEDRELTLAFVDREDQGGIISGSVLNEFGCQVDFEFLLTRTFAPSPAIIDSLTSCEDYSVCFGVDGDFNGGLQWDFGIGETESTSAELSPCFKYSDYGNYVVTLTNTEADCWFEPIVKEIIVPEIGDENVIIELIADPCTNEVCFDIVGNFVGNVEWNFGDFNNPSNTSSDESPCHNYVKGGIYPVTLTNLDVRCPFQSTSKIVNLRNTPTITLNESKTICEGESVELIVGYSDAIADIEWQNETGETIGDGNKITVNPTETTTYKVIVTGTTGCIDSAFSTVNIFKFDYNLDLSSVVCPDEEFQIKVDIENSDNYSFEWSPIDNIILGSTTANPLILIRDTTVLTLIITDQTTGCQETRSIILSPASEFTFDLEGVLCYDQASKIFLNIESPEKYNFKWLPEHAVASGNGTNTPELILTPNQQISVIVTDIETGCSKETSFSPIVREEIEINFSIQDIDIREGEKTELVIYNPDINLEYFWSNGDYGTSITVSPNRTTIYTVTATDDNGCSAIGVITVNVRNVTCTDKEEYLPTAFSPNGDGENDVLFVKSDIIQDMEFVIFNRWGQEMFRTTDVLTGWDGTYKGRSLSPDVFAYYLKATCINGDNFVKKGNINLLK